MSALVAGTLDTAVGTIELHRAGTGGPAPVVYLHSTQGEGPDLPLLENLADGRAVVAPQFPGFGASEGLEHIDDIEDAAFHLLDVLDRLGFARCDLLGTSLGGWVAAELSVRWPERVRRLVLVNAVGLYVEDGPLAEIFGRSPAELAELMFFDQEQPLAQLMHAVAGMERHPEQIPFELVRPVLQAQGAAAKLGWNPYLHDPKLRGRLHRVSAPTLVIHASGDGVVPRSHAEAYAGSIPDARIADVDKAAHLVVVERPDDVAALVIDHLGT